MRFAQFELLPERGELLRDGEPVEIRPKPLALLAYLVRNRDRSVSKNEVLDQVWPEVVVSDTALSSALKEARRALGDDGTEQRFLKTMRGRGYRFVHPVEADAGPPPPGPAAPAPAPLFGREGPLGVLQHALDDTASNGGLHVVVLSGAAGIGKTRLAEEALRRARGRGLSVYASWCWEGEDAPAFWPWKQLLRELTQGLDAEQRERRFGPAFQRWRPLVDEAGGAAPTGPDGEEGRFALFDAVAQTLAQQARDHGLAIGIDDLQWADPASLRLLQFVARALPRARMLLVATIRTEGAHPDDRLSDVLEAFSRLESFREVALGALEPADVAAWVEAALHEAPSAPQCRALLDHSGGNPLFLRHLLGYLESEEGRGWFADPSGAPPQIPTGIRDFIRARLGRLPAPAREALHVAAVLGQAVAPDVVAHALGQPLGAALEALDAAASAGLLTEPDSHAFRFAHALVREAVLEEVATGERADLHRRIGEALEALRCGAEQGPWWELAHHFAGAAQGEALAKASAYAERAGREAVRELAFEDAETRFRRALALLEASPQRGDRRRRCELLLALGEAQLQASRRGPASNASCFEAARLARELDAPELFARAALGFAGAGALVGQVDGETVALLEEALQRLPETPGAQRVYVTTRLGFELHNGPDRARARELCEQAAALAAALPDPGVRATALFARAWEQLGAGDPDTPLELSDEVVRLTGRTHDLSLVTMARNLRIRCLLELGDGDAARAEVDALAHWVEESRAFSRAHHLHARRAMLALLEGRLEDVARHVDAARASHPSGPDVAAAQVEAVLLQGMRREAGELSPVEPVLRGFVESAPQNWTWRCALADLYVQVGDLARASLEFERIIAAPVVSLPRDGNWHLSLAVLAEVCAALRDRDRAALLYDLLLPDAHLCVVGGNAAVCLGSLERRAGLLAGVLGRSEEAIAHYRAAIATNDRLGAVPEAARARLDLAELLLDTGAASDAIAALLDEVGRRLPRGGLPPLEARWSALVERASTSAG